MARVTENEILGTTDFDLFDINQEASTACQEASSSNKGENDVDINKLQYLNDFEFRALIEDGLGLFGENTTGICRQIPFLWCRVEFAA